MTKLKLFDGRPFGVLYERLRDQPRIDQVTVVADLPDQEFTTSFLEPHYPVVFNCAQTLPAKKKMLADLERQSEIIRVRTGDYADPTVTVHERQYAEMTIAEYCSTYLSIEKPSLALPTPLPYAGRIETRLRGLEFLKPPFLNSQDFESPMTWLRASGCQTSLHKDATMNFAIHVFGKKRWTLFPPRDAKSLYLRRVISESDFAVSQIDLRSVDAKQFPLFQDARSIQTVVSDGQVLFLPAGWSHFVENLEPSLMVNFWRSLPVD